MKKILLLVLLLTLLLPEVKGATINPQTLTLNTGTVGNFNLTLNNETCSLEVSPSPDFYGLPNFVEGTGSISVSFYPIKTGTYNIKYCDATLQVVVAGNQTTCPVYLKIYGESIAGKTIKFDIRDSTYRRVRNPDTSISIESSDTGNAYSVDCAEGSCSWQIPETEKGTLMVEVVVPDCEPLIDQIELKPAGTISISVPSTVKLGDEFYIYFFDPTKGALKFVTAQVIAPNGEAFNGKTNENGILYDESLTKIYGRDIKPTQVGKYQVFANLLGYSSVNQSFEVIKVECPFECCINESQYVEKACNSGYSCQEHKCIEIVKPKLELNCTKPTLGETSHCILLSDGTKINSTAEGKLNLNGKETTITFTDGEADVSFDEKGDYTLTLNLEGYESAVVKGSVAMPEVSIPLWVFLIVVVFIIIIVIIVLKIRKKGGRGGFEIQLEAPPSGTIEKVVEEK